MVQMLPLAPIVPIRVESVCVRSASVQWRRYVPALRVASGFNGIQMLLDAGGVERFNALHRVDELRFLCVQSFKQHTPLKNPA